MLRPALEGLQPGKAQLRGRATAWASQAGPPGGTPQRQWPTSISTSTSMRVDGAALGHGLGQAG